MRNKLKILRKYTTRLILSLIHGVKFKNGFDYKIIKHHNLDLLEKHHYLLLDSGWERITDVKANFSSAWCWYRKESPTKI